MQQRKCVDCKVLKDLSQYSRYKRTYKREPGYTWYTPTRCRECYTKHRTKQAFKRSLQKHYKISTAEHSALVTKQNNCCAICGIAEDTSPRRRLHIDHDHVTGAVRGLLCLRCNTGIGMFGENTKNLHTAISYLESKSWL